MSNSPACPAPAVVLAVLLLVLASPVSAAETELRVCSDPNNLPFSNQEGEGFENALAEIIAEEMNAQVTYTWWAQRRGFIRNTLNAGACDLVMGVPADFELVETTRPYYRSTYVFVHATDIGEPVQSIQDPRLRDLKIGVHLTGDDGSNPPPAHALGQLGVVDNVIGFMIYGDYREPNPPARLIDAVSTGDIDIAATWGPTGGYFARRAKPPLELQPITDTAFTAVPFTFSIAMGVRNGDVAFRDDIQAAIDRRQADIRKVLLDYDVPLVADDIQAAATEPLP